MHEEYLRRAIALAVENVESGRGGPFGAVIVKDGRILAEGANGVTTGCDPTAHAEVSAIRKACQELQSFELRGATIYSSCEPCPMCLAAIYWARLDALYYAASRHDASAVGFDDSLLYEQIPLEESARSLKTRRLAGLGELAPFDEWRRVESRIPY